MFESTKAMSSFSTNDLEKTKEFYGNVLGLETKTGPMGMLELHPAGGNPIMVYSKPNHEPASFTVLNFPVENVEKTVDELTAKGVKFEHYNQGPMVTDPKGIMRGQGPDIAWFKDPAGNILSVVGDQHSAN